MLCFGEDAKGDSGLGYGVDRHDAKGAQLISGPP